MNDALKIPEKKSVDAEQVRDACKNSLWYLCTQVLGYTDWDGVHDDIEKMLSKPAKRKMILIPRGHLKTSIITKGYVTKRVLMDKNIRVLIANQVWDKSREMLFEIKEFLTGKSILPKLFGEFASGRWRDEEIVIRQRDKALSAPTIGTTGVESEMTGSHFDLILVDDAQGLMNCQTKDQRDKVKKFLRSLTALLDPGGEMIVIGTRWHHDDVYQEIIDTESKYYDIMVRQVVEDGKIIFPKKFNLKFDEKLKDWVQSETQTMDYIDFLRSSMGPDFYAQYMNQPIDVETQLIKKDFFQYYQRPPENLFKVMSIDLAISNKQKSDYTAIICAGMDKNRNIYVLDTLRGRWANPSDIVENIFQMQAKWHPTVVGIETMGFQKTLKLWVEQEMRVRNKSFYIKELKTPPTMVKEYRTKALEPWYRNRKVYHQQWMKDLENELMCMSTDGYKGKHDDLIDAMAHLIDMLVPGDDSPAFQMPDNSWEAEAFRARKSLSPFDFFKE